MAGRIAWLLVGFSPGVLLLLGPLLEAAAGSAFTSGRTGCYIYPFTDNFCFVYNRSLLIFFCEPLEKLFIEIRGDHGSRAGGKHVEDHHVLTGLLAAGIAISEMNMELALLKITELSTKERQRIFLSLKACNGRDAVGVGHYDYPLSTIPR